MAYNKSILGGSPLGLIGVRSHYSNSGLSTFNAGKTRNVRVDEYNKNSSKAGMLYGNSLFSGYRVVRAWPEVSAEDPKGINQVRDIDKKDGSARKELHNNSIYDVSVLNIIEQLSTTKAALRPADFAYLKNVGVYPNNRLMIARRFGTPADDNIMVTKTNKELGPFATLISWVPEGEDFLNITFGEEWTDSEADFKNILTSLGDDIGLGNLGGIAGAAGNALPLPGFTEIFQRRFLAKLGLIESSAKNTIPAGNPNLIKESKRRKLIGYGEAGSGLKCTVNIKMVCEYELKYISGIDPTIVWMDLLGMIARFGTSNSNTYGLDKGAGKLMISWANNPSLLIKAVATAISDAIDGIINEVKEKIAEIYKKEQAIASTLSSATASTPPNPPEAAAPQKSEQDIAKEAADKKNALLTGVADAIQAALSAAKTALEGLLQKYRVKIIGVINSLTGLPSTPWHITIGNPMRPTFCSGDMLCENVSLSLGPNLAFNDLPSSIKVEFNLTNARNWGLQEIMAKFNSGYLRTVDVQKTFYETNIIPSADGKTANVEAVGVLPLNSKVYETKADENKGSTVSNTPANNTPANNTPAVTTNPPPFLGLTEPPPETFLGPVLPRQANDTTMDDMYFRDMYDTTKAQDGKLPSEGALSKIADDTPVITKETNNVPFAAPPAPAPFLGPVQPRPLTPPSPIGPPEPPVTPPEPPVTPETPPPPTPPQ